MKINIKATGIELTSAVTEYVEKKVTSLEKYLPGNPDIVAQVEVGKSTQHHKSGDIFRAEIHLVAPGLDLYAASEQTDLYASIDIVKDELVHRLTHEKGKRFARARRGARVIKDMIKGFNPFKNRY